MRDWKMKHRWQKEQLTSPTVCPKWSDIAGTVTYIILSFCTGALDLSASFNWRATAMRLFLECSKSCGEETEVVLRLHLYPLELEV